MSFLPTLSCALCVVILLSQPTAGSAIYLQKVRTFHSEKEFLARTAGKVKLHTEPRCVELDGSILSGSAHGIVRRNTDGTLEPFPSNRILPQHEITVLAQQGTHLFWFGTRHGAIRYHAQENRSSIQYFAGKRWLPADDVTAIGFEGAAVWIATSSGLSRIEFKTMTLGEKARWFEERVRSRHVRHGLTASSHLRIAGDLSSNQTVSSDNDGLWTALYLAAECFRYKVTGNAEAREFARQALEALMRLESITSISGFPARSFIRVGVEERPRDGEWHRTADGQWEWKGDTSSDEVVGHYLAYAAYYDLVAGESERQQIRAVVERITSHIVDHGYHLIDTDGKPTRWGWWAPDEIWAVADETGLRALHLLSHLRVAAHITGNSKFKTAYDDLVARHRYALLTRNQKINVPGHVNHSDDELAFLSYYPLLLYERDPQLRKIFLESLERSWQIERPERNPLWNFIYAIGSGSKAFDAAASLETLQQIPTDLINWDVYNSHRLDIERAPAADRFGQAQSLTALPVDERPLTKWNGNPYALDGGNGGRSEDDGSFFLLAYWMGRYYGLIP